VKVSLGLLPSGPDPVGEEHVRANLPKRYMRRKWGERKASGGKLVGIGHPAADGEAEIEQAYIGKPRLAEQGLVLFG
jgi:hypothetical protein